MQRHTVYAAGGCMEWRGPTVRGYGRVAVAPGRYMLAHRASYSLKYCAWVPSRVLICHRCDNPLCVNPLHLFAGSNADNSADMKTKGRQARGVRNGAARLTARDVMEIRGLVARGLTRRDAAQRFGISEAHAGRIVARTAWSHVQEQA